MITVSERFGDLGRNEDGTPDGCTYRLGIMGGTFDPIHIGHLACAEQVRVAFDLDAVLFIPTGSPAFKQDKQVTDAQKRLRMCQLACLDNPHFDVSSLEIDREGVTYTIDTLRALRAHYTDNVQLLFITGADAILSISQWRDFDEIVRIAQLIAVTRPGYALTEQKKAQLAELQGLDVSYFEMTALSVSSSMLRDQVAQGKSIRYLTPDSVWSYIDENKLYRF